jgi:hypothetical protein
MGFGLGGLAQEGQFSQLFCFPRFPEEGGALILYSS